METIFCATCKGMGAYSVGDCEDGYMEECGECEGEGEYDA